MNKKYKERDRKIYIEGQGGRFEEEKDERKET